MGLLRTLTPFPSINPTPSKSLSTLSFTDSCTSHRSQFPYIMSRWMSLHSPFYTSCGNFPPAIVFLWPSSSLSLSSLILANRQHTHQHHHQYQHQYTPHSIPQTPLRSGGGARRSSAEPFSLFSSILQHFCETQLGKFFLNSVWFRHFISSFYCPVFNISALFLPSSITSSPVSLIFNTFSRIFSTVFPFFFFCLAILQFRI